MAEVTELVTRFSFQGDTRPLQSYNQSLNRSIGLLAGMVAALGTAAAMLRRFTTNTLQGEQAVLDLAQNTRNSVQEIRELSHVADQTNSSSEALRSTIQSLDQQISDAALNGSEDFARLGISVRQTNGELKNSVDVLMEARDRIQEMGLQTGEAQNLAETIGIDRSLINMLQLSENEFAALTANARQYGQVTEENTETIQQYNNAQREMQFGMDTMRTLIAVGMAPTMQRLSTFVSELTAEYGELITDGLQVATEWIGNFIAMIGRLLPLLGLLAGSFIAWKAVIAGMAVWAAPALAIPAAITAAIVALVLIIDDLIVAFQGGESVIASFFEEFFGWDIQPVLVALVDAVKWALSAIGDTIGDMFSIFQDLASALEALFQGNFDEVGEHLVSAFRTARDRVWAIFEGLFDMIRDAIGGITDGIRAVAGFFGFGGGDEGSDTGPASGRVGPGPMDIQPGFVRDQQGGNTSNQVNQTVEVRVEGTDAEGAGRSVARALQRQLRDADQHLRGGPGPRG